MELWRKYGSTDFETSSPILKACVNNQKERLTLAIINFHDVNSNDKKTVDSPKFLQHKLFA